MAKTLLLILLLLTPIQGWSYLFLKERLALAKPGDFVVTAQKKTYTLWLIREREKHQVLIEEITVPSSYLKLENNNWKGWVEKEALGHTSWVAYAVDVRNGRLLGLYSFDNQKWCEVDQNSNFLTTLLNLGFTEMPLNMRRRVGPSISHSSKDQRPYWNPSLVYEGQEVKGVPFDHFQAKWPRDGSELAEKWIDIYLPSGHTHYPSYFPYWLQVSGHLANAKIRIIDSGSNLKSPLNIKWTYQQLPNAPATGDHRRDNG